MSGLRKGKLRTKASTPTAQTRKGLRDLMTIPAKITPNPTMPDREPVSVSA